MTSRAMQIASSARRAGCGRRVTLASIPLRVTAADKASRLRTRTLARAAASTNAAGAGALALDTVMEIGADMSEKNERRRHVEGLNAVDSDVEISREMHERLLHLGARRLADVAMLSESELQSAGLSVVDSRKLLSAAASATPVSSPGQTLTLGQSTMADLNEVGLTRGERSESQILLSSVLAGTFLSWGATMYVLLAGGSADLLADAPGLHKVLAASVFPMGLTAITLTGSDLLTSNMLYGAMPLISGDPRRTEEAKTKALSRLWTVSLAGNFVSCAAMAAFVSPIILATPSVAAFAKALAIKKTSGALVTTFGKAVAANWLVNVAIFQAATAKTSPGKMAALWVPVTAFVALGLEHSVANMFLIPLGALCGADIPLQSFFLDNLVPVLAGNAVGASICVGWLQWNALMPPKYVPGQRP